MDVRVGDVITVKKPHPCGSKEFDVLRVGMDFKIRCRICGHEIMLPRARIEKNIRKITRPEGDAPAAPAGPAPAAKPPKTP